MQLSLQHQSGTLHAMSHRLCPHTKHHTASPQLAAAANVKANATVTAANIEIKSLKSGLVIADLSLHLPTAWTPEQLTAVGEQLKNDPVTVFSSEFKTAYGVTGVTSQLSLLTPLPGAAAPAAPTTGTGLSPGAQAGIALGVLIPVTALSAAGLVWWRRRRAAASAGARYAAEAGLSDPAQVSLDIA